MNKKNNRKFKMTAAITVFITGAFCMMILPLLTAGTAVIRYYQIMVNQKAYGCYETSEDAVRDLVKARKELAEQQEEPVMIQAACSIEPVKKVPKTSSPGAVYKEVYEALEGHMEQKVQPACTLRVNEFTVTVASEAEAVTTLELIKNKYDTVNAFEVQLIDSGNQNSLTPVCTVREGAAAGEMIDIGFEQKIEIVKGYVNQNEISDAASAAAALTKEYETPAVYTVEKGDCLSIIAEKNGMKTKELMELNQLTDSEYINIGDELIVTVPKPEVSVWYKLRSAYEEEYQAEIQYVDNDQWYTGTEKVLQEGTFGRRQVVAEITYSSGQETGRELLEETLLAEAQPRVIERGTSTPPTYIKPLVGGSFSSPFGSRWGRMHKGIDWSCPIGTAIRASCGGRVVSAGWVNGYGNCITIRHSDGKQTRYAHLSKILVSSGSQVKQGEKIALSGNTGNSTGPHLHFEILVDGVQVNPSKYLN